MSETKEVATTTVVGNSKKRGRRGGRSLGTPNKATTHAREAIAAFVDNNSGRLQSLLDQIEQTEGPKAAWECIIDLVEFHVPKLARTEHTGKDGGAIIVGTTPPDESI